MVNYERRKEKRYRHGDRVTTPVGENAPSYAWEALALRTNFGPPNLPRCVLLTFIFHPIYQLRWYHYPARWPIATGRLCEKQCPPRETVQTSCSRHLAMDRIKSTKYGISTPFPVLCYHPSGNLLAKVVLGPEQRSALNYVPYILIVTESTRSNRREPKCVSW